MLKLRRSRRRAEGYTEYVIVSSLIMVCSVSTLLTAGSNAMRELAEQNRLCVIQGEGCANDLHEEEEGEDAAGEGEGTSGETASNDASSPTPWWRAWANDPYLASFLGIFGWFWI